VLKSDYEKALDSNRGACLVTNPGTATLYLSGVAEPARFEEDWLVGWGQGENNVRVPSDVLRRFMLRTKSQFDPAGIFNKGEFGFL
jgi:hypothetical protein